MRRFPSIVKRGRVRCAQSRLWHERRGATAVEYGLIVAVIVIAMIASFKDMASTTVGMWGNVNTKVAAATGN